MLRGQTDADQLLKIVFRILGTQMMNRLVKALGVAVIAIGCGGLFYMNWSGASASTPIPWNAPSESPTALLHPVVAAAVAQVQVPPNLETPVAVQAGAHLFRENCVQCHGAPDLAAAVKGLKPAPPNLLAAGRRNDPAEVFSKVTNGISGTAMPSFGDNLPDQSRWALAAFLHQSRGISADDFNALSTAKTGAGQDSH